MQGRCEKSVKKSFKNVEKVWENVKNVWGKCGEMWKAHGKRRRTNVEKCGKGEGTVW